MKSFIKIYAFIFLSCGSQSLLSQTIPHAIVKGHVVDDSTGAPLPLANVFVSSSTIGAATNTEGQFVLRGVPLGEHEVVASILGYDPQSKPVRLSDTTTCGVLFRLRPRPVQLQEVRVEAKEPEGWKENLEKFLKEFLGEGPNADQCKVLNPEVLDFAIGEKGVFTATASAPLEIENRALGYHIHFFLDHFTLKENLSTVVPASAGATYETYYGGKHFETIRPDPIISKGNPITMELLCRTRFTPIEPRDNKERSQWQENRRQTYLGSLRHFLISSALGNSEKEGFAVYSSYYHHLPGHEFGMKVKVDVDTLIAQGARSHERKLSFTEQLQVVYSGDGEHQTSAIWLSQLPATFYVNGEVRNPLSITTSGDWSTHRVSDLLPIDYSLDQHDAQPPEKSEPAKLIVLHSASTADIVAQIADSSFIKGDFKSARVLFDSLAHGLNDARGFVGLARIALTGQDWLESRRQIDKALDLDSNGIETRYYAAVIYRESARWRVWGAYQAQGLSAEGAYARSKNHFQWILQRDSTYEDALYQYALLMKYQRQYGDALVALCDEARLKPQLPFIYPAVARLCRAAIEEDRGAELMSQIHEPFEELKGYVRAEMLRHDGKAAEAEAQLRQQVDHPGRIPSQLGYRALLRILAAQDNPKEFEQTYWKAIAEIKDEAGAALMFEDIKYILTPQEMMEFSRLTTEQRRDEFFVSAWSRRNPVPGLAPNERLHEHYQRLVYAESRYAMDRERYSLSLSKGFLGINFELKDAGLIYVRLGPPSDVSYGTLPQPPFKGDVEKLENWHYDASGGSPEIMLYFYGRTKSFNMVGGMGTGPGGFMLQGGGGTGSNLTDHAGDVEEALLASIPPELASWDPNYFYLNHSGGGGALAASKIVEESARSIATGLSTERHMPSKDLKIFTFPFVASTFRGGAGTDVMEVAYEVPAISLFKEAPDSVHSMNVESGFAIYDKRWKEVVSVAETVQVSRLNSPSSSYYRFRQSLVKPDSYHVAIFARPLEAKLLARSEWSTFAPNYGQPGLSMSDLQLALDIRQSDEYSIFNKEGLKVVANPVMKQLIREPLYVYFEVYNATESPDRRGNIDLDLSIVPAQTKSGILSSVSGLFSKEKKGFFVTSEAERWKRDKALAKYLVLDVTRMQPGSYVLEIKINDRTTKKTVSRSVTFELIESNSSTD